jgi:hypothetical protein
MPCSLLEVNRRFGGTYRLHLQGRISRANYQCGRLSFPPAPGKCLLLGNPEGKRPLGKPIRRGVDHLKMDLRDI